MISKNNFKHASTKICRIDEESSADECGEIENIEESKNNFACLS